MITSQGESIISKYLVGQTPSYASYLSIGCGASAVLPSYNFSETSDGSYVNSINPDSIADKKSLDFELGRFPIISKGYVTEIVGAEAVKQLVVTAQIPAEGRYGITEVGIFPSVSNPIASGNDSRSLLSFSSSEPWVKVDGSAVKTVVPDTTLTATGGVISETQDVIFVSAYDTVLQTPTRVQKKEIFRNGTKSLVIPGNFSTFTGSVPSGQYVVLQNPGIDLSANASTDKLKIVFSVMSKNSINAVTGTTAKIAVEFGASQDPNDTMYSRAVFETTIRAEAESNRYYMDVTDLKAMASSNGFTWSSVKYVKVFASTGSANDLIVIDGLRIDNENSISPVYGLVGYTVLKNSVTTSGGTTIPVPVVKDKDKTNLIEFRFQVKVV